MMDVTYLRSRLDYEPDTGVLRWRAHADMRPGWNTRWAGREALTSRTSHGYRHGAIRNVTVAAHKVVWALHHGEWPTGQIDHINHDRSDNRIENLRLVTNAVNHKNMPVSRANTSGVVGVSRYSPRGKWQAQIKTNGVNTHLGHFDTFEAAVKARKDAEERLGFHKNHGKTGAWAR